MAAWIVFLIIAVGAFGTGLVVSLTSGGPTTDKLDPWLIALCVVMAIGIPTAWVIHRHLFKTYWRDGVVKPRGFVTASICLWSILTALVLLASISAMLRRAFVPDMLIAVAVLVLLIQSVPDGYVMTHRSARQEVDDEQELFHVHNEE